MKRHATDWEEIFANHTSNNGLVSRKKKHTQTHGHTHTLFKSPQNSTEKNPIRKKRHEEKCH